MVYTDRMQVKMVGRKQPPQTTITEIQSPRHGTSQSAEAGYSGGSRHGERSLMQYNGSLGAADLSVPRGTKPLAVLGPNVGVAYSITDNACAGEGQAPVGRKRCDRVQSLTLRTK